MTRFPPGKNRKFPYEGMTLENNKFQRHPMCCCQTFAASKCSIDFNNHQRTQTKTFFHTSVDRPVSTDLKQNFPALGPVWH